MGRLEELRKKKGNNIGVNPAPLPESDVSSSPTPQPDSTPTATVSPKYGDIAGTMSTSTSPSSVAGSTADNAGKITYSNSGIAPTITSGQEYRQGALQTMSEEEFEKNKAQMNASDKEYSLAQVRQNPNSIYAALRNYYASDETPAEKEKREKQERANNALIGLGQLIGSAANLYYTAQGAEPINYSNLVKEQDARMQRIKDKRDALKEKQDAILLNAKMQDAKNAMTERLYKQKADAAQKAAEQERAFELMKLNANLTFKQALERARQEEKAKQLAETERHNIAMEQNSAARTAIARGNSNKVTDSVIGEDGSIYTRNTRMTDNEAMQIVMSSGMTDDDLKPFMIEETDIWGNVTKNKTDWRAAAAWALQNGMVSNEELESRGFIRSENSQGTETDNVPPSLRRKSNNDNVPPSMRK